MLTTLSCACLSGRQVRVYILLTALLIPLLFFTSRARGVSTSVVISQIQIAGTTASDEFVELYNASSSPVDLSKWRLTKETANGATTSANLVASLSGTIAPHGYFLVTSQTASSSSSADLLYSTGNSIAANNTVILYSDAGITIIDKVGMGSASNKETSAAVVPASLQSIGRSSCGVDTDDNSADFSLSMTPMPKNTQSAVVCLETPAPTTPSPTPAVTPSPTPEPTSTPTATPEPTLSPTPSPTIEPTPEPTPEITPLPTVTPTPTPSPSPRPSSDPRHNDREFRYRRLICHRDYGWYGFGRFRFRLPRVSCRWEPHHDHDD